MTCLRSNLYTIPKIHDFAGRSIYRTRITKNRKQYFQRNKTTLIITKPEYHDNAQLNTKSYTSIYLLDKSPTFDLKFPYRKKKKKKRKMIEAIENFNGPRMDHCPSPSFTTNSNRSSTYSTFSLGSLKGRFSHIASLFERTETDTQREQQEIPQHPSALSPSHALRVSKNALPFSQRIRLQQNKMQRRDRIAKKTYEFFFFNNPFKRSIACKEVVEVVPAKPKRSSLLFTKHEEPSTLDFCCIGTGEGGARDDDDDNSLMSMGCERMASDGLGIWGGVQKRHEGDVVHVLSDCAPTIDWVQPRISLEWTNELPHFS